MIAQSQREVSSRLEELRIYISRNLAEFVDNKIVFLSGPAIGSQVIRQYFLDSGASCVLDLPVSGTRTHCISHLIQIQNDYLVAPSEQVCAHLEIIDPKREAKIYAGSCVTAETMDGRQVLGRRLQSWRDIERKRHQCTLTAGQDQYNPCYIDFRNGLEADDLLEYCVHHQPCVLSGDPKDCIAMGCDFAYVFQQDTPIQRMRTICHILHQRCEGVRVANLTDGIPATYYGFVSNEQYVLYGPVEALVGFHRRERKVFAPGILTPVALSDELRKTAREDMLSVVSRLVNASGYRGAFGVDGCLTRSSFIVHEVNTRMCAGFSLISRSHGDLIPFGIIDMVIRERTPEGYNPLMAILRQSADHACLSTDVKLWDNPKLENALRGRIPQTDDMPDPNRWQTLVRRSVLMGNARLHV